jgi:hypothetical protein
MSEPIRLRDGAGAARVLMAGANMHVPQTSRRRAVAFTSAAATMGASATAVAAGASSLIKTFVLCVVVGAAGGGVMSLLASETFSRLDAKAHGQAKPAPERRAREAPVAPSSLARAPEVVVDERQPEPEPAAAGEPTAKEPSSKGRAAARDEAPAVPPGPPGQARPRVGSSLVEEQRIIESARAAVARGDLRTAFSMLDNYEHAFGPKQFWPEALALRIEALRSSGQLAAARALAADFAERYPHHPLLQRVQDIVAR